MSVIDAASGYPTTGGFMHPHQGPPPPTQYPLPPPTYPAQPGQPANKHLAGAYQPNLLRSNSAV
jgi:hypothetical protein